MSGASLLLPTISTLQDDYGSATASSKGTQITSGTANVKGAYVQLTAATTADIDYLIIGADPFIINGVGAIDIAIGASGSEVVILANLALPCNGNASGSAVYLPFAIPAGSRVAARWQSSSAADKTELNIVGGRGEGTIRPYSICDTYGFNTATSAGTPVDPGATANTKGAWVQMTAASLRDISGLMFNMGATGSPPAAQNYYLIDIGIGASGSEKVIASNIMGAFNASFDTEPSPSGVLPLKIPAGTRIAMRMQCSSATAGNRVMDATMYGFA